MRHAKNPRKRTLRTETYGKGSTYQDKQGRWWFQPPPKDGKRLPRVRAVDERAAKLAQRDHLAKREQGVAVSNIPTVEQWFDFWLRQHVAPTGIEASTLSWYRYIVSHYILPAIGRLQLDAVQSDHLILLINQIREHVVPQTGEKMALSTVARVHEMLNRAFKKATVSRKIPFNPMDAVERPRVPRTSQRAYTPEHVAAFRQAIAGHRLELLYDLMFLQGFRRGEALALLITGYDRGRGVLKVSGQVQTVEGETKRKSKTKSISGAREVPLTPRQQRMMDAHLARLAGERDRRGVEWKEHGLLFPSEKGTPIIPRNFNRHYYQAQEKAGIPHYTLHALRHTAATTFNTVRASKPEQQAIMGHSPGDVGEGYIHPRPAELAAVLIAAEREQLRWAA